MPEPKSSPRTGPGARAEGQTGQDDHPQSTSRPALAAGPAAGWQYRVTYRRDDWLPTTSDAYRTYEREADVDQFVAKLTALPHAHLSPLTYVRVEIRQVGPWQEVARW